MTTTRIHEHRPGRIIAEDTGLGITPTDGVVIIQIIEQGRDEDQKKALNAALAIRLEAEAGVRPEDLVVSITANTAADWSVGLGRAQFLEATSDPQRRRPHMTDTATGSLAGKAALVTGASSGIGQATALTLAAHGAAVSIGARRVDRLDTLADRLRSSGASVTTVELDVTDEQACTKAVARTRSELGGLDILVNSAGLMLLGPIVGADTEDWRRMMSTNVLGLMYMTHAVIEGMVAAGAGDIVNISSVAGRSPAAERAVTTPANGPSTPSAKPCAKRSPTKGRVTMIEPGAVQTDLNDHITNPDAKKASETATTRSSSDQPTRPRRNTHAAREPTLPGRPGGPGAGAIWNRRGPTN